MRHILSRLCLTTLAFAGLARADVRITFPSGTFLDSESIASQMLARTVDEGKGTTTALSMSNQVMRLSVSWADVPEWGAHAGVEFGFSSGGDCGKPMSGWNPIDFSSYTAVSFKYKTSDIKTAVQFAPVSDLYPGASEGVMMVAAMGSSVAGTTKSVSLPSGITYLKWMNDSFPDKAIRSWEEVKTSVVSLRFSPMPAYNSTGDTIRIKTAWLEVSEIRLVGALDAQPSPVAFLPARPGSRCVGNYRMLSDFKSVDPNRNALNGTWYTYSDTGNWLAERERGQTKVLSGELPVLLQGDSLPTRLGMSLKPDKGGATAHPYAGWGGLGTTIPESRRQELAGLRALSFFLEGDDFDTDNLTGVELAFRNTSIGDSIRFSVLIPMNAWNRKEVCVDLDWIRQPLWVRCPLDSLPTGDIEGIEWEVKIRWASKDTAAPSTFSIGDVKLWGTHAANGITRTRADKGPALVASYSGALRLSYSLKDAASAKIEVLQLDGRSVASFEAPSSVQAQAFPVTLGQGTYLAVVRSGSIRLVAPFVVAR